MTWRPEGWSNPYLRDYDELVWRAEEGIGRFPNPGLQQALHGDANIYEAGADAMLAALKASGRYCQYRNTIPVWFWDDFTEETLNQWGWWIWLAEE